MIEVRSINLAFRNCASRKWVSLLSLLTVTLGSIALTATFIVNDNVNIYIGALVEKLGGPTLKVRMRGRNDYFRPHDFMMFREHPLVIDAFEDGQLPSVKIRWKDKFQNSEMILVDSDSLIKNSNVIAGRKIKVLDDQSNSINLSEAVVKRLGLSLADLPQDLYLTSGNRSIATRLVGIYKPESLNGADSGYILAPKKVFYFLAGLTRPKWAIIEASSIEHLDAIESYFKRTLLEPYRDKVNVINMRARIEANEKNLKALVKAGLALGFVAVLAGSLGMMNMMMLTIRIRKKEIGLYRALGFSSWQIMMQFFYEFLILSSFGALLGVFGGVFAGGALSRLVIPPYDNVSPLALVIGFVFTVLTGVFFAIFPARAAVQLEPVEALRG